MTFDGVPPRRVVVTGGESTGKTTLARALAEEYAAACVPEAAREAALAKSGPLGPEDVEPIARAHIAAADAALRETSDRRRPILVLDQDLLSTVVYARHYYGSCPRWIERLCAERVGDLYLLCRPDLPWAADGVRDRPEARAEIHALFREALAGAGANVVEVTGAGAERTARAVEAVEDLLAEGR
jgi:NadR type nicotinamide-nucleotide adenylyltransferase